MLSITIKTRTVTQQTARDKISSEPIGNANCTIERDEWAFPLSLSSENPSPKIDCLIYGSDLWSAYVLTSLTKDHKKECSKSCPIENERFVFDIFQIIFLHLPLPPYFVAWHFAWNALQDFHLFFMRHDPIMCSKRVFGLFTKLQFKTFLLLFLVHEKRRNAKLMVYGRSWISDAEEMTKRCHQKGNHRNVCRAQKNLELRRNKI